MRADAQRNLDRVIDEVARRAGVGHGTVFRRFPTKEALLDAVLGKEMDRMMLLAQGALAESEPWEAFTGFFRACAEGYGRNRALVESTARCQELPQMSVVQEAAHELVRRAQKVGALRPDLTAEEIFELVPAASRFPDVILDGLAGETRVERLRPEAGTVLSGKVV